MLKINFKKTRYAIPLLVLPFICLIFYSYRQFTARSLPPRQDRDSLQGNITDVSDQVKKSALDNKLDAYRDQYRKAEGYTAIGKIPDESDSSGSPLSPYNAGDKQMLDSVDKAVTRRYRHFPSQAAATGADVPVSGKAPAPGNRAITGVDLSDRELASALNKIKDQPAARSLNPTGNDDPMQLFRQQMTLIDSMGKSHDPAYQAEQTRNRQLAFDNQQAMTQPRLPVAKTSANTDLFNTVCPPATAIPIQAIIDQDITGYAGSRLRIRLLDDLMAGSHRIRQGTYLYALVSGFRGQRVLLSINSILSDGLILPVKLLIFDNDGLEGLYVPASAFRDFTRDLGGSAGQGMTLQQQADGNNQMVMSVVQKMFESTTTAVTRLVRQNKARIKYDTRVYLIDPAIHPNKP
jgi:conjugative transposon TraM protein